MNLGLVVSRSMGADGVGKAGVPRYIGCGGADVVVAKTVLIRFIVEAIGRDVDGLIDELTRQTHLVLISVRPVADDRRDVRGVVSYYGVGYGCVGIVCFPIVNCKHHRGRFAGISSVEEAVHQRADKCRNLCEGGAGGVHSNSQRFAGYGGDASPKFLDCGNTPVAFGQG